MRRYTVFFWTISSCSTNLIRFFLRWRPLWRSIVIKYIRSYGQVPYFNMFGSWYKYLIMGNVLIHFIMQVKVIYKDKITKIAVRIPKIVYLRSSLLWLAQSSFRGHILYFGGPRLPPNILDTRWSDLLIWFWKSCALCLTKCLKSEFAWWPNVKIDRTTFWQNLI